jgi:hypothetical protein
MTLPHFPIISLWVDDAVNHIKFGLGASAYMNLALF